MNFQKYFDESFKGKNYMVTGSTQGLGFAIAHQLFKQGASKIVITGRNTEFGYRVEKELSGPNTEVKFIPADLANTKDCLKLINDAYVFTGNIHGLVNCAGTTQRGSLLDLSIEDWDHIMAINLRAPFILTQEICRRSISAKIGTRIVNIISKSSYAGQPNLTAYSTSKGGLQTFTYNCANAMKKYGIRVNGINLGWTRTDNEEKIQKNETGNPQWEEAVKAILPFNRLIEPKEVAILATYFFTQPAEMMTGVIVDFDQFVHFNCE